MKVAEALATGQDVVVNADGQAEVAGIALPGLPEGVVALGYKNLKRGDFWMQGEVIRQSNGGDTTLRVLTVRPSPGYRMIYSITLGQYVSTRIFEAPKEYVAHFKAKDAFEEEVILALQSYAGFVRFG